VETGDVSASGIQTDTHSLILFRSRVLCFFTRCGASKDFLLREWETHLYFLKQNDSLLVITQAKTRKPIMFGLQTF
jgi:hypothetical protein